jgi:hypothetical protein
MIHLSKDGIRFTNHYNPNCDKYVDKMVDSLIPFLREEVTLSDDYTLEDLFKVLEKNLYEYNIIFNSELGHHPLECYVEDINEPFDPIEDDDIEYLEVQWICTCEDWESQGYKKLKKEIQFYFDFHGWGTWYHDENSPHSKGTKGGIAIEYTPLKELKYLPLKIKTKTEIRLEDGTFEKDENGKFVDKILFSGDRYFSVYEFVAAILYEISWGGSPENRDEVFKKITQDCKEAKEAIENGDESKFMTFDDLKKELDEKMEE